VTTHAAAPHIPDVAGGAGVSPWQRLLPLSGVLFAPLFVVGWLTSNTSNAPDYTASNQAWVNWAQHDMWRSRISAFTMLLAAFVFFYFLGAIRSVIERAESVGRGSAPLSRVAFAGALTGMVGMAMAFVTLAAASSNGAKADPVVSKAVTTGAAGAFLVSAMGFRRLPAGRRSDHAAKPSPLELDRLGRAGRGRRVPDHLADHTQRDDKRQRLRLRVLPGARVAHRLDDRNEHRRIPSRSAGLSDVFRGGGLPVASPCNEKTRRFRRVLVWSVPGSNR
jgi:hypothetical protein